MTIQDFRAKAYEILTSKGYIIHEGQIHFPESAVLDMFEFLYQNFADIPVEHFDAKLSTAIDNAIQRLSQGPTPDKTS